ncbi:host-nuclease inhibitor Gam family protein [Rubinisphaera italica]|uniref:Bacteriophage Mu Gam like protein n=1 Tax=Rubinisphaera italica TaxID=2527969 RepID=A0A5C5XKV9_9PLAN|nr:host-nuclease inhibitor Gam family protein [Rubinisphaera italica]TWT63179.1 Bacteriophage Mu Gam like protein [Rubinisphaera italica]
MSWYPKQRLAAEPQIETSQQLEIALAEMAAIETRRKALEAAREQDIQLVKDRCESHCVIPVERTHTAFNDRLQTLEKAVEVYAKENREQLLAGGKTKSVKLTHATLKWSTSKQSIDFLENWNEKKVIEIVDSKKSFLAQLLKCIESIKWFRATLACLFTIKVTVSKTAIAKALAEKKITPKELKGIGLAVIPAKEKFSIDLTEYQVTNG